MKKLDKEAILKHAQDLMLALSDEELESVDKDAKVYLNQIASLQAYNTEGVEPMSYPFEVETHWFREDEPTHVISREAAFENAPRGDGEYFEVVKVVNK